MYTELQVGVMPTQYQGFPMKAGATREWTEYFTTAAVATGTATDTATGAAMDTAEGGKGSSPLDLHALHSPDYHGVAIPTVDAFLDDLHAALSLSGTDTFARTTNTKIYDTQKICKKCVCFFTLQTSWTLALA